MDLYLGVIVGVCIGGILSLYIIVNTVDKWEAPGFLMGAFILICVASFTYAGGWLGALVASQPI